MIFWPELNYLNAFVKIATGGGIDAIYQKLKKCSKHVLRGAGITHKLNDSTTGAFLRRFHFKKLPVVSWPIKQLTYVANNLSIFFLFLIYNKLNQ